MVLKKIDQIPSAAADRPAGVALGFLTRSSHRLLAPLTSQLWFDSLPAVAAPLAAPFVNLLEAGALNLGCLEFAFGSQGYRGGSEVLRARGYTLTDRVEFELDLAPDEEDLWEAMEHKRRKNVNKSRRASGSRVIRPARAAVARALRRVTSR